MLVVIFFSCGEEKKRAYIEEWANQLIETNNPILLDIYIKIIFIVILMSFEYERS